MKLESVIDVGKLKFCTFNQNCNGLISWSFEIPASAYCHSLCSMQKETVQVRNEIDLINCQCPFGTFASSDTQADAPACKRAKFLPTLATDYWNY